MAAENAIRLRWPGAAAAVAGATAVALAALGAHALRTELSPRMLGMWRIAVRFQFWHALALAVCALPRPSLPLRLAATLFALGIVLVCGSLYALAADAPPVVRFIPPLGEIAFIAGWIALGVALYRRGAGGTP